MAQQVDFQIAETIFNTIGRYPYDPPLGNSITPELAENWEVLDGARTWIFHLRKGVKWHKGYGELTAEDVKFNWWHHHKAVMEVHEQAVMIALRSWWDGNGVHDLDDLLRAALFSDGMMAEEANRVGVDMSLDTEHLIRERADMPEGGDAPVRQ